MRPVPATAESRLPIPRPPAGAALLPSVLLALALSAGSLAGQSIRGTVLSPSGPVADAQVRLDALPGTLTRFDGGFLLAALPPGPGRLTVSVLGFETRVLTVDVPESGVLEVEVLLAEAAIPVDPIVVTGTLSETRVSDSPVKVEVVSAKLLRRNAPTSVMDAIGQVNGLYQQVDCAVCYTNNIRINGMEGPYTAILIDGMPIQGALASVYGLNGIHPSLIERLEILKGPQSTLYGTEAMGGVVNVITRDPRFAPIWVAEAFGTSLGEFNGSLAWSPGDGRGGTLLSGTVIHNQRFIDGNGDDFSDIPLNTRINLFAKTDLTSGGRRVGGLSGKIYWEDRFGGVSRWSDADRGSDQVYGESIWTRRAELLGSVNTPIPGSRVDVSYAYHDQDSYYGDSQFAATQHIGFAQFLWDRPASARHDLLFGATLRADHYDDSTPATTDAPDRQVVPGLFVEDQVRFFGGGLTVLGGLRADVHRRHGVVLSPRASAMVRPDDHTTLRLNAGTGFRTVHLFTEDHAALTGAREVIIEDELAPERSWNVTANLNREFEIGRTALMLDLDGFYTEFTNRIIPDYDVDPNWIVYRNLDGGRAVTRGGAISMNQNFGPVAPFFWTAGITFQDVFVEYPGEARAPEFYAPRYRGVWTLSYTFFNALTLDYTGSLTGPMRLPEYPEPFSRATTSPAYSLHNLQASYALPRGGSLILSLQNLGDFRQGSPLIAPDDPFGEDFDTSYVWGPIVGRRLSLGFRWASGR
jgi:outer membrane receptor for ferrienterochelin and colicins